MTTIVGWKARVRLSDAIIVAVWLVVVDLAAAPPLARWINGDPPRVRMDPDALGVAGTFPGRAITVNVPHGSGSDHALLFIPVAISILLITVGAVLVAMFARTLAAGELTSGRAGRLAGWLGGLLGATALALPAIRTFVGDQGSGFGMVYEPDLRLLVAGVLVGACAVALRRADGPPPAPPER